MMSFMRPSRRGRSIALPARRAAAVLLASLAGGCSAQVSGFDFPSFSLNDDKKDQTASLQSSGGRGPSYLGNDGKPVAYDNGGYSTPRTYRDNSVNVANLPEPPPSSNYAATNRTYGGPPSSTNYAANDRRYDAPTPPPYGRYGTAPAAPAASPGLRPGELVEVQPGDTLYALSRRHQVSVAELMQVNGLSNPNLQPGQKLYLPEGYSAQRSGQPAPSPMTTATVAPPPSLSPEVDSRYGSSYTMKQGDSLYGLSRSYGVSVAELQQVNGITDTRSVRAGTVLRVPGNGGPAGYEPAQQVAVAPPQAAGDTSAYVSSTHQPTIINRRDQQVAGRTDVATTGAINPPPARSSGSASDKLRWPVSGRIITGFGQRNDGTHNDGINLSVPLGTSVHAAESGTVAYAGSELKGYGNLILLRHDNGWVTAYAHNEQLTVKRGDKVQRGQVIATAGRSGSVDQPQVHFELRQGSKPVDPVPFLERL